MSGIDVGTAFVRVVPDTRNFRALLQKEVDAAVAKAKVSVPVGVQTATARGTTSAAASTSALAAANAELLESNIAVTTSATAAAAAEARFAAEAALASGVSIKEAVAAKAVADALDTQLAAEIRLTTAITARATETKIASLESSVFAANQAVGIARLRQAEIGPEVSKGLLAGEGAANALRGSLIGLSRITPVAVFGLGAVGTAAIAAGLAIKGSISSAADFEQQLNTLAAVSDATPEQLAKVREEAKALGADTSLAAVSALDAATAITELSKAGLSLEDSLAGARGTLQLAGAAQIQAGQAAEFLATELNAFGLAGTEATHVADLLAGASVAAQGEITDFAAAFQQVAAVAHQVNLPIEQTTGLLTELAQAGLRGADGGTSLRTTLLRLVPTTKEAAQFTEALGIQIDKTKSVGEQITSIIEQYRVALAKLTPVQQQQALTQIFGQDAIRAASIIFSQQAGALEEVTAQVNKAGEAQRLNEARTKGLNGAFQGLISNTQTLGITLGELAQGPLTGVVEGLTEITTNANKAAEALANLGNISLPGLGRLGDVVSGVSGKLTKQALLNLFVPGLGNFDLEKQGIEALIGQDFDSVVAKVKAEQVKAAKAVGAGISSRSVDEDQQARARSPLNVIGGVDETQQAIAKAGAVTPEQAAARQKLQDLIDKNKANQAQTNKLLADVTAPPKLEIAQLNAQISGSLQAELQADKAIEAYFQDRLALAKKGTARYAKILGALAAAHAATQSVIDQINSEQEAANAKAKAANDKAVADAKQKTEDAQRAAVELAKADIDFRRSQVTLAEALAANTPGIGDDKRAFQLALRELDFEIAQQKKLFGKSALLTKQAKAEINNLKAQQAGIRKQIKGLKDDSSSGGNGFTLAQFFQEAADEFNTFGSNVTQTVAGGGILSGQDARGAVGGIALNNRDRFAAAQVSEQQRTNAILERGFKAVADAVEGPKAKVKSGAFGRPSPTGVRNAWAAAAWIQGS